MNHQSRANALMACKGRLEDCPSCSPIMAAYRRANYEPDGFEGFAEAGGGELGETPDAKTGRRMREQSGPYLFLRDELRRHPHDLRPGDYRPVCRGVR